MQIKVLINTPKGNAKGAEATLRSVLLLFHKPVETFVNEENTQFIWVMEGSIKQILAIQKRVAMFDVMTRGIFSNKMVKKFIKKYADSEEDVEKLYAMLKNQTKVTVLKMDDLSKMQEDNKTWWEKVKEKWKKE